MDINPNTVIEFAFNTADDESSLIVTGRRTSDPTDEHPYSINMSTIMDKLIQDAGRFCIRYASDLLIDIDAIIKAVNDPSANDVYGIGIRENGVDGNSYITSNLLGRLNSDYYRCIYGISITHDNDEVRVEMRDIRSAVNTMASHIKSDIRSSKEQSLLDMITKTNTPNQ